MKESNIHIKMYEADSKNQEQENDVTDEESSAAWNKMRYAIMRIINSNGFFAHILYKLKVIEIKSKKECPTMQTDGFVLAYNPHFVLDELTNNETVYVVAHEVMHNVLMHMMRLGDRRLLVKNKSGHVSSLWNIACDYAVNLLIDGIGDRPKSGLYDTKYTNMSADEIYEILRKEMEKDVQPKTPKVPDAKKIREELKKLIGELNTEIGKIKKEDDPTDDLFKKTSEISDKLPKLSDAAVELKDKLDKVKDQIKKLGINDNDLNRAFTKTFDEISNINAEIINIKTAIDNIEKLKEAIDLDKLKPYVSIANDGKQLVDDAEKLVITLTELDKLIKENMPIQKGGGGPKGDNQPKPEWEPVSPEQESDDDNDSDGDDDSDGEDGDESEDGDGKDKKGKKSKKSTEHDSKHGEVDEELEPSTDDLCKPGSLAKKYGDEKGQGSFNGDPELEKKIKQGTQPAIDVWKEIVADAATKVSAGSGSENFRRYLRLLKKAKVNWKQELHNFVATIFNKLKYTIPNRRYIGDDLVTWGITKKENQLDNVVIAIDTSGSISDSLLAEFATEIKEITVQKNIKNIYVIYCDSSIPKGGIQHFDPSNPFDIKKMEPVGGGGTSFTPPFYWVNQNLVKKGKKPTFMLYFTDAEGEVQPNIAKEYEDRVMWVITKNIDAPHLKFGKKIFIDVK